MKTIVLDNNIEYALLEEITLNNTNYTLFSNINNPEDITIRKTIYENNESYYIGLDSKEEVENVLMHMSKEILTRIKESEK